MLAVVKRFFWIVPSDIIAFLLIYIVIKDINHHLLIIFISFPSLITIQFLYISCKVANKYPLNNPEEYIYNPRKSKLGYLKEGIYSIQITEIEKGIWKTSDEQNNIQFNLKGYIYPKLYICSFFIRNFHYIVLNKNKYPLRNLFHSLDLSLLKKYRNVEINFNYKNKIKKIIIVNDYKTKVTYLISNIIKSKFSSTKGLIRRSARYEFMNEKIYNDEMKRSRIKLL